MVLTQTKALLVDAYREINSRKLFWVSIVLSLLLVAVFGCLGISSRGVSFLWWTFALGDSPIARFDPGEFYRFLFVDFGANIWLSWIATILALISTAGIVPDMIAGGAIETVLSKPISRRRLFITKYVFGLLFTTLQVGVFSGACFLVMGLRGGVWELRLFLAVPIVVSMFSFLFSICALLGMLTRSTVASLLLTLLIWFFIFCANASDNLIATFKYQNDILRERMPQRIARIEATTLDRFIERTRTDRAKAIDAAREAGQPTDALSSPDDPVSPPSPAQLDEFNRTIAPPGFDLARFREKLAEAERTHENWLLARRIVSAIKTPLPKTQETIALLDRYLLNVRETPDVEEESGGISRFFTRTDHKEMVRRIQVDQRSRSLGWVLGTSFAFEALVLGLAAWIFGRRDF